QGPAVRQPDAGPEAAPTDERTPPGDPLHDDTRAGVAVLSRTLQELHNSVSMQQVRMVILMPCTFGCA
ncbi:hypothetical protein AVEN_178167-1, partial [Araneus ventricosus]